MRRLCACVVLVSVALVAPVWAATDITHVGSTVDLTNAASYTFTNHAIGTASADRCVLVSIHSGISVATAFTITGVTIGGNAATVIYQQDADAGGIGARLAAVAALLVTSGTTATIVVTPSTTANRMRVSVHTLTGTGGDCTTLADSDFSEAADPSVSLDVPDDGSALGVCTDTVSAYTWTGLTEIYDHSDEAAMVSGGAALDFADPQTGLTITCDSSSAADSAEIGIFVSFAPAAGGGGGPPAGSLMLMGVGK